MSQSVSPLSGSGVYKDLWPHDRFVIDLSAVKELHEITHHHHRQGVMMGAGVTIQQLIRLLRTPAAAAATEGRKQQTVEQKDGQSAVHHHCSSSSVNGGQLQCQGNGHCAGSKSNAGSGVTAAECGAVAAAPSTTKEVWSAVADHLERIAGWFMVWVMATACIGLGVIERCRLSAHLGPYGDQHCGVTPVISAHWSAPQLLADICGC